MKGFGLLPALAVASLGLLATSSGSALAWSDGDDVEPVAPRGPFVAYLALGFGGPTGIFGGTVGFEFAPSWAIETGFGLGLTGYQIPLMLRWYTPILRDVGPRRASLSAFSLALGPSVGLISRQLGLNVPHDEDKIVDQNKFYAVGWLNLEVAWETRAFWGGAFRVAVGGGPRIIDTMSKLCTPGVPGPDGTISVTSCDPPHLTSGPRVANSPAIFYVNFGIGWEFGR